MNNIDIYELDPNFAVVYSFLKTFGVHIGEDFKDISIREFKEFLEAEKVDTSHALVRIHRNFIRAIGVYTGKPEEWEKGVVKFCKDFPNEDGKNIQEKGYANVSVEIKLRILKNLCEDQFEFNDKFNRRVNEDVEKAKLRESNDPIGQDTLGRSYWFLLDREGSMRLYRGWRNELTGDETWNLVCRDCDELSVLIDRLQDGKPLVSDDPPLLTPKPKDKKEEPVPTLKDLFTDIVTEDVAKTLITAGCYYKIPNARSLEEIHKDEVKHKLPHCFVKLSRLKEPSIEIDSTDSDDSITDKDDEDLKENTPKTPTRKNIRFSGMKNSTISVGKVKKDIDSHVVTIETDNSSDEETHVNESRTKEPIVLGNERDDYVDVEGTDSDPDIDSSNTADKQRSDAYNKDDEKSAVKIKNQTDKRVGPACASKHVDKTKPVISKDKKSEKKKAENVNDALISPKVPKSLTKLKNVALNKSNEKIDGVSDISDAEELMPTLINENSEESQSNLDVFETIPVLVNQNKVQGNNVCENDIDECAAQGSLNVARRSSSKKTDQRGAVSAALTPSQDSQGQAKTTDKKAEPQKVISTFSGVPDTKAEKSPKKNTDKVLTNATPKTKQCVVELEKISPSNENSKSASTSQKCGNSEKVNFTHVEKDQMKSSVVEIEKLSPKKVNKNGKIPVCDGSKSEECNVEEGDGCDNSKGSPCNYGEIATHDEQCKNSSEVSQENDESENSNRTKTNSKCSCSNTCQKNQKEKGSAVNCTVQLEKLPPSNGKKGSITINTEKQRTTEVDKYNTVSDDGTSEQQNSRESCTTSDHDVADQNMIQSCVKEIEELAQQTCKDSYSKPDNLDKTEYNNCVEKKHKLNKSEGNESNASTSEAFDNNTDIKTGKSITKDTNHEHSETESEDEVECDDVVIETCSDSEVTSNIPADDVGRSDTRATSTGRTSRDKSIETKTVHKSENKEIVIKKEPIDIDKQNIDNALKDLITLEEIIKHGKTAEDDKDKDNSTVPKNVASTRMTVKTEKCEDGDASVHESDDSSNSVKTKEDNTVRSGAGDAQPDGSKEVQGGKHTDTVKMDTDQEKKHNVIKTETQIKMDISDKKDKIKTEKREKDPVHMEVDGEDLTIEVNDSSSDDEDGHENQSETMSCGTDSATEMPVKTSTGQVSTKTPSIVATKQPTIEKNPQTLPNQRGSSSSNVPTKLVMNSGVPLLLQNPVLLNPSADSKSLLGPQSIVPGPTVLMQAPTQFIPSSKSLQMLYQPLLVTPPTIDLNTKVSDLIAAAKSSTGNSSILNTSFLNVRALLASKLQTSTAQPKPIVSKADFLNAHKKTAADTKGTTLAGDNVKNYTITADSKKISKEIVIVKKESGELFDKNTGKPFNLPPDSIVAFLKPDGKYYEALSGKCVDIKLDWSKFKQKPAVMCIKKQPTPSPYRPAKVQTIRNMEMTKSGMAEKLIIKLPLNNQRTNTGYRPSITNSGVMTSILKQPIASVKSETPKQTKSKSSLKIDKIAMKPKMVKSDRSVPKKSRKHKKRQGRRKLSDVDEEDSDGYRSVEFDDEASGSETEVDPSYDYEKVSARVKLAQAGLLPRSGPEDKKGEQQGSDNEQAEMEVDEGKPEPIQYGWNMKLMAKHEGVPGIYHMTNFEDERVIAKSPCVVCGKDDNPKYLLICDDCEKCYHIMCLPLPLFLIPLGDWFCPQCEQCFLVEELKKLRQKVRRILYKKVRSVPGTINIDSKTSTQDMFELSQANIIERKSSRSIKAVNYSDEKFDKLVKQAVKDAEKDSSGSDTEVEQKDEEQAPKKPQKRKHSDTSSHKSTKSQGTKKEGNLTGRQASEPTRSKRKKLDSDLSDGGSDFSCSESVSSEEDCYAPKPAMRVKSTEPVEEIYYTSSGRKTNSVARVSKYL